MWIYFGREIKCVSLVSVFLRNVMVQVKFTLQLAMKFVGGEEGASGRIAQIFLQPQR
jgi:hypothetical protein